MYNKYSLKKLISLGVFFVGFHALAMDKLEEITMPEFKYEDIIDGSLRLKVTNMCPFTCKFCHNEGTELPVRSGSRTSILLDPAIDQFEPVGDVKVPDIEDMGDKLTISFMAQVNKFKSLGYNQVHLTGGEPSAHPHLGNLVKIFKENGFVVKMTSNGQFNPKKLESYVAAGLSGITFSILSLDPREFLDTQLRTYKTESIALASAKRAIEMVKKNIIRAKELGLNVKVNAIILNAEDKKRVDCIADFAQESGVTLSLLPCVLSSDSTADDKVAMERLAFQYALDRGARYVKTTRSLNSSSGSHRFVLPDGLPLAVKFIQDFQPEVLCGDCEHFGKVSCTENFYGIRVEYRDDKPFFRMCVQKSTPKTLKSLDDFIASPMVELTPREFDR
jgi:GTP 3',8-cyclase